MPFITTTAYNQNLSNSLSTRHNARSQFGEGKCCRTDWLNAIQCAQEGIIEQFDDLWITYGQQTIGNQRATSDYGAIANDRSRLRHDSLVANGFVANCCTLIFLPILVILIGFPSSNM